MSGRALHKFLNTVAEAGSGGTTGIVGPVQWNDDHQLYLDVNAQTGTTYTLQGSDSGTLVTFNNVAPTVVTLPAAQSGPPAAGDALGFYKGWFCVLQNIGAGPVTVTPASGTVGGGATLVLYQGQWAIIVSDGANYDAATTSASTYTYPAPSAVARPVTSFLVDRADVRDWGIIGSGDETTKLQTALNEVPLFETLWAPKSLPITVSTNGLQCLELQRPINLNGLNLSVASSVGNTIDCLVIYVNPAYEWYGLSFSNLIIGSTSAGRYGRAGIRVFSDSGNGMMFASVFDKMFIVNGLSTSIGPAFRVDNGGAGGAIQGVTVRDSWMAGGILFNSAGDRNSVDNCVLAANSGGGAMCDLDFVSGSANFHFVSNNMENVGVIFRSGLHHIFRGNTVEQTIAAFQPNSAMVDFDGGNSQIVSVDLDNNCFNQDEATSGPTSLVRFNNVANWNVNPGNRFGSAVTQSVVKVTGSAANGFVSRKNLVINGSASMVDVPNNVTYHDKARTARNVGNANTTLTPWDHTVNLVGVPSGVTWTLPPISQCFNDEEFVLQDVADALGSSTPSITVAVAGSSGDVFQNNGTGSYTWTGTGSRLVLHVVRVSPTSGYWHVAKYGP